MPNCHADCFNFQLHNINTEVIGTALSINGQGRDLDLELMVKPILHVYSFQKRGMEYLSALKTLAKLRRQHGSKMEEWTKSKMAT